MNHTDHLSRRVGIPQFHLPSRDSRFFEGMRQIAVPVMLSEAKDLRYC